MLNLLKNIELFIKKFLYKLKLKNMKQYIKIQKFLEFRIIYIYNFVIISLL